MRYEEFKRKFNHKFRFLYLTAFVVFVIYIVYSNSRAEKIILNYHFNGIAEKVIYDGKSTPTITVHGKDYYLGSSNWNFNHLITSGDSIKKDSGTLTVTLIKQKSGRVLVFDGTKYHNK